MLLGGDGHLLYFGSGPVFLNEDRPCWENAEICYLSVTYSPVFTSRDRRLRDMGRIPQLLIITLVPLVAAGMLAAARPTPAGAEPDCP
jgi:hypothetical protein